MERQCRNCGCDVKRRQSWFCITCALARASRKIGSPDRKRPGVVAPLRIGEQWCCVDCHAPVDQRTYRGRKCRPPVRCDPCAGTNILFSEILSGRRAAGCAVSRAVFIGALPKARDLQCVDCNGPAECYDHRDYAQPLKVDAVCRSCNSLRGPAAPVAHKYFFGLALLAENDTQQSAPAPQGA